MSKLGVGVGEDFPVGEPNPDSNPGRDQRGAAPTCGWRGRSHRFGWLHFTLGVLLRVALIGFIVAAAVSLFTAHRFSDGGYGNYPYPHHFFFPLFPILFLVLILFAFRRGAYWRHRHWHDHWHGDRGEGA